MKQLILDFQNLFKNNWKVISIIVITVYLLYSYPDIKQGIVDGFLYVCLVHVHCSLNTSMKSI